jgi:hypothetical protein
VSSSSFPCLQFEREFISTNMAAPHPSFCPLQSCRQISPIFTKVPLSPSVFSFTQPLDFPPLPTKSLSNNHVSQISHHYQITMNNPTSSQRCPFPHLSFSPNPSIFHLSLPIRYQITMCQHTCHQGATREKGAKGQHPLHWAGVG